LGIYIIKSCSFKCSFDHAKRAFYRSLNAIFGHIGRSASEGVVINLVTHKCLPILLYGTEVCPVSKSDNSLDFAINRFLMKFMFKLPFLENSSCNIFNLPVYLAHRTIVLHLFVCLFALFLYFVFVFVYY